jgi:hypothetical protein
MIRNLLMAVILVYLFGQAILVANAYPLHKNSFTVTGAQCDPDTGACYQKGDLAKCNSAKSCGREEYALWLNRHKLNISWIILVPLEGLPQMNTDDQNDDPLHGKPFTVTGGICDPDGKGCYQKGYLSNCNSAWSCWREARAILEKYGSNITWVVLSPQD